jgi:hypothetical protein
MLAKECYSMKLELLTNTTVVDDAMRFAHDSKDKLKGTKEQDSQDSKEPEYDDKVTELEKRQEEQGIMTTNQIF